MNDPAQFDIRNVTVKIRILFLSHLTECLKVNFGNTNLNRQASQVITQLLESISANIEQLEERDVIKLTQALSRLLRAKPVYSVVQASR